MPYSIVNYSEVNGTFDFRIDGEYWHPKYLQVENKIENHKWSYLANIAKIKGGKRLPLGETFSEHGVPYIRAEDVKYFVDYEHSPRISNELHQKLAQYQTQTNDILITIVGNSIGDVGFVKFDLEKCNLTENCAKLTDLALLPDYVFLFLISKYGQNQIHREKVGTAQPKLALTRIANLKVPILDKSFQIDLQNIVTKSYEIWEQSKYQYLLSRTLLLSELGLADWQPQHRLTFVKNYSDTKHVERVDAEYYQPKYEEIDEVLIRLNAKPIGVYEFLDITTGQYCPNYVASNEGRPYLRGTDLAVGSIAMESLFYIKPEDQIQSKQAQEGDVVVTRVGTIGLSARIPEECDGGTISDNLIRLRILDESKIDSYYLSCFLGSEIGKSLMLRNARGSVQQRLNQETLKEIMLPIPEMEVQSKIKDKIIESFNLRKQSKHLLECAKRAVEVAIEQDEQTAIDWLERETQDLNY